MVLDAPLHHLLLCALVFTDPYLNGIQGGYILLFKNVFSAGSMYFMYKPLAVEVP